jgi:uncharacterized protein YcnI
MRRHLAFALALFFACSATASAHVTVIPAAARPGQTETIRFRVLNERDSAKTVRIDIFMPSGLKATASDRAGWTRVDKPGEFDWTAKTPGDAIGGAGAKDFEVRVGPLPQTGGQVVFKALQYYSDGQIVRWIQAPTGTASRPSPVLQLTATGKPTSGSGNGSSATGFAVLAVVLAAAAGGAAIFFRRRARRV